MGRPVGTTFSCGYRNTLKTFKKHVPIVYPHAILSSDKQVVQIRSYPRATSSNAVIPIPPDVRVAVGDYYNPSTKSFQKEPPDA